MTYRIVSLKCDESKNDWIGAVSAEAVIVEDGADKPIYLEAGWIDEVPENVQCEQNKQSVHDAMIFAVDTDIKKLRKGGKIFKSYESACKSKYGDVFPVLKQMIIAILHNQNIDSLDDNDEEYDEDE